MLICTIMGEIYLVAAQQKINRYGILLLHLWLYSTNQEGKRVFRKYIEKWPLYDK